MSKTAKIDRSAGVSLTEEDYLKLSHLAAATGRSMSSVIRQLIRLAEVPDVVKIRLEKEPSPPSYFRRKQGESDNEFD